MPASRRYCSLIYDIIFWWIEKKLALAVGASCTPNAQRGGRINVSNIVKRPLRVKASSAHTHTEILIRGGVQLMANNAAKIDNDCKADVRTSAFFFFITQFSYEFRSSFHTARKWQIEWMCRQINSHKLHTKRAEWKPLLYVWQEEKWLPSKINMQFVEFMKHWTSSREYTDLPGSLYGTAWFTHPQHLTVEWCIYKDGFDGCDSWMLEFIKSINRVRQRTFD